MARTKESKGTIEAFLRTNPGPISSTVSPQRVLEDAHKIYVATCAEPVEIGPFIDHLWARGIQPDKVGDLWWLRIPGRNRDRLATCLTPP